MIKTRQSRHSGLITAYLILVLAVWLFIANLPRPEAVRLPMQTGITDLSASDFSDAVYYYRDNYWENYPEALLTPADFNAADPPVPTPLSVEDYRVIQYATHRMRLRLPSGTIYAVTMKSADYAMRLFIDGSEAGTVGNPGATAESAVPGVANKTYYFTPAGGVTTVLVQTSNWVHREGAYPPSFHIGTAANIDAHNSHTQMITFLITGALLTAFLYHLGLFALNRRRPAALLFSVCCLLLAQMESRLFDMFFPSDNWYFSFQLEYIVHFLTFSALCRFLEVMFPRLYLRAAARAYYALAGLYILSTFVFEPKLYSRLLIGFHAVSAAIIVYTLVRLAMGLRARKIQNTLAFAGILPVCLFGAYDMLLKNQLYFIGNLAGQEFAAPIAMCFLVFCFAMVISADYDDTERSLAAERRQVESLSESNAALDRASRMRSEIISTISHESRTPLAVLASYAGLVSMELKAKGMDEQITADLDTVAFEAERVANLIDGMRKLSRQEEVKAERALLDIGEIIRQTARLYKPIVERGGAALVTDVPAEQFPVFGSAAELTQVVFNLLQNAKKHTERGVISASLRKAGGGAEVTVSDTGTGIDGTLLPRVFERGAAGEKGGTGIGLAICREIIENHGGSIAISSEPGAGTAVTFTLPISGAPRNVPNEETQHGE